MKAGNFLMGLCAGGRRKEREMKKGASAYLTVYLALTMGVLVTLSLALIQAARQSTLQMEAVCIADIGMDSVMAEYHRELFRQFNLLALDTSYGTETVGRENVRARLKYYLEKNMKSKAAETMGSLSELACKDFLRLELEGTELDEVRILTDESGAVFRSMAAESVRDDLGISTAEEAVKWLDTVKQYELDTRDVEAEKREADEEIESLQEERPGISEEEWETDTFENPTKALEERKKSGVVSLVLGNGAALSSKSLNTMELIGQRIKDGRVNRGNAAGLELEAAEKMVEGLWFQEYLLRYLGNYTSVKQETALDYELEYAIVGKSTDMENLRGILMRLLAMREAANAVYLHADKEKYGEAGLIALGISLLVAQPELQEPLCEAIILGWAYAESVYDVRTLVNGGRIPLIKNSGNWHYNLQTILQDLWGEESGAEQEGASGLSYGDYLRILLLLTDADTLNLRVMDLVEADIRMTPGNRMFRLDGCYVEINGYITVGSGYGYTKTISVRKKY